MDFKAPAGGDNPLYRTSCTLPIGKSKKSYILLRQFVS